MIKANAPKNRNVSMATFVVLACNKMIGITNGIQEKSSVLEINWTLGFGISQFLSRFTLWKLISEKRF